MENYLNSVRDIQKYGTEAESESEDKLFRCRYCRLLVFGNML